MDNNSQIPEISGKFQQCGQKSHPGRLYPEKMYLGKHINENDRRHKEKQIAKRRHDKKLKKLQRKKRI